MSAPSGTVLQLNLKPLTPGEAGLPKRSVPSASLTAAGVEGDYNRYRQEKRGGTPDRAVLLMPVEVLRQLQAEGWPVQPGHLGENVTTSGIAYADLAPGARFKLGQARIEVSEPCTPCQTLGRLSYVDGRVTEFIKTMLGRRGWYARVLEPGVVRPGDAIARLL